MDLSLGPGSAAARGTLARLVKTNTSPVAPAEAAPRCKGPLLLAQVGLPLGEQEAGGKDVGGTSPNQVGAGVA